MLSIFGFYCHFKRSSEATFRGVCFMRAALERPVFAAGSFSLHPKGHKHP